MEKKEVIILEMMKYCEKEQNYSYVELRNYAEKNNLDWIDALNNKKVRMTISEYLKSKSRKQMELGDKTPTLKESLDKINKD